MPITLLRLKLQSLGPLRPEAWERIVQLGQPHQIAAGKNLVRRLGSLVYVAEGLLKEYDHHEREEPAIVNFIGQDQCMVTRGHQQQRQLQACLASMVYQWDMAALYQLAQEFAELRPIYDALCAEYEVKVMLRMRLLEMPVQKRIDQFKFIFKPMLPYLTKKDMANYLHLEYTNFIKKCNI